MSMQLFSFGHPCEHQLRRTCIGGSSCPLNGYPDNWCCSYIKGKINFKRDKPCEGPRCRWGFVHPTQSVFEAVTQVLNESRPIAAKIDDAEDTDLLSFHIDNQHIVDTVQCALHMMRHPPSSCALRVGQLLACAAVTAGDQKVFMQLLKTMKKPVDNYILGAYAYLTQGNSATAASAAATTTTTTTAAGGGGQQGATGGGKGAKGKAAAKDAKKDDVSDVLRNDMVDLMNAALGQGGQLVDRDDQHVLQATFIQALRQYPKANKKRMEMLEAALAKFGNRQAPKNPPPTTEDKEAEGGATTVLAAGGAPGDPPASAEAPPPVPAAQQTNGATAPSTTAAPQQGSVTSKQFSPPAGTATKVSTPSLGPASAAATPQAKASETPGVSPPALPADSAKRPVGAVGAPKQSPESPGTSQRQTPQAAAPAVPRTPPTASSSATTPPPPPPRSSPAVKVVKAPIVGVSEIGHCCAPTRVTAADKYVLIRTDEPLPPVLILGGLFSLTQTFADGSLLGVGSVKVPPPAPAMRAAAPREGAGTGFAREEMYADSESSADYGDDFRSSHPAFAHIDPQLILDSIEDDW